MPNEYSGERAACSAASSYVSRRFSVRAGGVLRLRFISASYSSAGITWQRMDRISHLPNFRQIGKELVGPEINDALKQEHARREAAIKNMYRLRELSLARDTKLNNSAHK